MFEFIKKTPITIAITAIAVFAFLFPAVTAVMELDTTTSLLAQVPQLFTCHALHWSFDHLSWDLLMFVLVGLVCERKNQAGYAWVLFLSAILIPLFVVSFAPSLSSYRGLSGLDTGIFAFAAILLIEESLKERNWQSVGLYGFLFLGMLGKIAYELVVGGTLFVESSNFSPVPIAHITGAVIGAIVGGFKVRPLARTKSKSGKSGPSWLPGF